MLAWQVGSRLNVVALEEELRTNSLSESHSKGSGAVGDLAEGLLAGAPDLLDIFHAQGLVVRLDGTTWHFGSTPAADAVVAQIASALQYGANAAVAASHHVGALVASAADDAYSASGALLMSLSPSGDEFPICFRKEMIERVSWGGDPTKPVEAFAGGLRPRMSFVSWRETMRGRSARWSAHDLSAGRSLRQRILDRRQTIERGRAEERIRYLAHNDVLTQLPNRAHFMMPSCKRSTTPSMTAARSLYFSSISIASGF